MRIRTGCVLLSSLMLGLGSAIGTAAAFDTNQPVTDVSVQVRENLSGFNGNELTDFLVHAMMETHIGPWRFVPAGSGPSSPDRIEWSFIPGAEAAGSVRTYGFSRAMMERLVGSSRVYTIEARLYLHGEYQALSSGQFRQTEDPQSPEFSEEIEMISRSLMATPEVIERGIEFVPSTRAPKTTM